MTTFVHFLSWTAHHRQKCIFLAGAFRCWMQDTSEKPSSWGRGKRKKWLWTPGIPPVAICSWEKRWSTDGNGHRSADKPISCKFRILVLEVMSNKDSHYVWPFLVLPNVYHVLISHMSVLYHLFNLHIRGAGYARNRSPCVSFLLPFSSFKVWLQNDMRNTACVCWYLP